MLLMSGRTPVMEGDRFGARTVPIGWGQEMRDQTALVREACKWDYELKFPEQIAGLLDRAHAIANSTPKGPIYLSLPREVLCEATPRDGLEGPTTIQPVTGAPNPTDIETAARWLAEAKNPLVIAQRGAGDKKSFKAFAKWAEEWGIAVCSWWATHLAISTEHPCHVGSDPGPWMEKADVVVVLNCIAPWWPDKHKLADGAKVINVGPDPVFSRFPVRNFRSDLTIAGETALTVPALIDAMAQMRRDRDALAARRDRLAKASAQNRASIVERATDTTRGITKSYVSHCLGKALEGVKSSIFSELGTILGTIKREDHNSWFQEPHSGGLGWSFPTALGAQLAEPDRVCVATMGDGSYMFSNPTACHQIAEALELPVLVIILNNEEWGAVRASVEGLYPSGNARMENETPMTSLRPSPDFTQTAAASRAHTQTITDGADLPAALKRAIEVATTERRQVLLNIAIARA